MVTLSGLFGAYCAIAFMLLIPLAAMCVVGSPRDTIAWTTVLIASALWIIVVPISFLVWLLKLSVQRSIKCSKFPLKRR